MSNKRAWLHPKPNPEWAKPEADAVTKWLADALLAHLYKVRGGREWADVNDPGAHFVAGAALALASKRMLANPGARVTDVSHFVDELARGTGSTLVEG